MTKPAAENRFFFAYTLMALLVGLLGFGPSFIAGIAAGFDTIPLVVHLHGLFMMGWLVLLATQGFLIWRGVPAVHRQLGKLSVLLFPLMWGTMLILALNNQVKPVPPPIDLLLSRLFAAQLGALFLTPVFFLLALSEAPRNSSVHKRLMVLLTGLMLGAAIMRLNFLPGIAGPDTNITLYQIYTLLVLIPVPIFDFLTFGRVTRGTLTAMLPIFFSKVFILWAWSSETWIAITKGVEQALEGW